MKSKKKDPPLDENQDFGQGEKIMRAALEPFGWKCGNDFWKRYYSDPWVFNLANAVVTLSQTNKNHD